MAHRVLADGRRWAFCDQCGKPIPVYQNGAVQEGYVSPEIWKIEQEYVEGLQGFKPVSKTVCATCYLGAFARQYPGTELPNIREEGELPEWVSQSSQPQPSTGTPQDLPAESSETDIT